MLVLLDTVAAMELLPLVLLGGLAWMILRAVRESEARVECARAVRRAEDEWIASEADRGVAELEAHLRRHDLRSRRRQ